METIIREKNEKFSLVTLFARLLGIIGKIDQNILNDSLEEYREELYQLKYNFRYRSIKDRRIQEKLREAKRTAKLMERLEQMTVTDEDIKKVVENNAEL
jgi:hypothetical protein